MNALLKHECKMNLKSLIIWTICVSGLCLFCILLFSSIEESMAGISDSMAQMGAFSSAFGMDKLSIATLAGFYATEVGTVHSLGGAMFAAILGTTLLSKEEEGHTGEFLFSLPISRNQAVGAKALTLISNIMFFNAISVVLYLLGFVVLGESVGAKQFFLFHLMQMLMHIEVGSICFFLSAFGKKNKLGIGLGIAFFLYIWDLFARVIPDIKDFIFITPFSYANAADIFSTGEVEVRALAFGIAILVFSFTGAFLIYSRKDLAV